MIEDPLPIWLQISVFYLARELTRSMSLYSTAALKMDGFCSFCATRLLSVLVLACLNIMRRRSVSRMAAQCRSMTASVTGPAAGALSYFVAVQLTSSEGGIRLRAGISFIFP